MFLGCSEECALEQSGVKVGGEPEHGSCLGVLLSVATPGSPSSLCTADSGPPALLHSHWD